MVTVFIFLALLVGTVLFFERRERRYGVSLVPYFLTVIIVTIVLQFLCVALLHRFFGLIGLGISFLIAAALCASFYERRLPDPPDVDLRFTKLLSDRGRRSLSSSKSGMLFSSRPVPG